ncbi:MAG: DUF4105 domain-containing protein [Spirochaetales bacterium]|nr:DUF4105 domain-containing protein [Spirochaetales bacterium]
MGDSIRIPLFIFLVTLMISAPFHLFAENPDIDISLVTIGPGSPLYVWWGHTAFIITDHDEHKEYFINFGLFQFDADNFYLNFVLGKLYFMVGASNAQWEISSYKGQDRRIVRQYLNLSSEQKHILYEGIRDALKKENRVYRYDHYDDNCATRPRDLIDAALDGALGRAASSSSGLSIREQTRRFTGHSPFIEWWLMYGQGGVIDREARLWDSMFLPSALYQGVASVPGLVAREEILYDKAIDAPARPGNAAYLLRPLLAGLLLALLPLFALLIPGNTLLVKTSAIYEQVLLGIIGLLGAVLLFLMTCTEHTVVAWNFNALLNPCFALVPLCMPPGMRARWRKRTWSFLWVTALVMTVIQPVFIHKNLNVILVFMPVYTVLGGIPLVQAVILRYRAGKESA